MTSSPRASAPPSGDASSIALIAAASIDTVTYPWDASSCCKYWYPSSLGTRFVPAGHRHAPAGADSAAPFTG